MENKSSNNIKYKYMNKIQTVTDILYPIFISINGSIRESTYFSLLSILISVAIFAADLLKNDKKSIEKRMIVSNLPIRMAIIIPIITIFLLWFSNIEKIEKVHPVANNIYQIVIDVLILVSYYNSALLIWKAINFSSNETYYDKNLKQYIEKQETQINKETKKSEQKYRISDAEFDQLLHNLNCKRFEKYDFMFNENKVAISANFNGLIRKLSINILDKYCNKPIQDEETLYLRNCLGEYINKGDIIAYCNRKYEKIYRDIDKFFIIDKEYEPFQRRYAEINDLLFDKAPISNGVFDSDNYINHNLDYLFFNKCFTGKDILIDKVISKLYENEENIVFINQYRHFIKGLMRTAMKYDDINAYFELNNAWNTCNYIRLKKEEDRLIDDYLQYINYDIYSLKHKDIRFYDACMSIHLKFVYLLIKNGKYNRIYEILKSNHAIYDTDDTEEISLVNLSFICGVIKGLFYKKTNENNGDNVDRIINSIGEDVSYFEGSQFINEYKKIEKCIYTYRVLDNCDFYIENHKNGEIFSIDSIDNISLLLQILDLFNIYFFDKNKYEKQEYFKEDKVYYSLLFKAIKEDSNNNCVSLKEKSNIEEYINFAYNQSSIKEEEYIKEYKIDNKQLNVIKDDIKEIIVETNQLLSFLNENHLIVKKTKNNKKSMTFSKLIPRKDIVDYENNKDFILYQFRGLFSNAIINSYCNIINNKFKSYNTIEEFSGNISNDDYVIFINEEIYYEKLMSKIVNNRIKINENKYRCFQHLKNIVNIIPVKCSDLPYIYINDYDNQISNIRNSCLIDVYDISNNDSVRKEFINEFKDKYSEEKLKSYVLIRIELMYEMEKYNRNKV